jgi:hypothetical protein
MKLSAAIFGHEEGMALQQYLIPHRTGDERLLVPGWAGELSDPELAFIEERLRGSRRLSKQWGITSPDYTEQCIRQVASAGIKPESQRQTVLLPP